MKPLLPCTLIALIAAGTFATPVSAQDSKIGKRPIGQDDQAESDDGGVSERGLRRLIERAGFEIDTVHENNVLEIEVTHDDWTFPVLVELSPDASNLWCTVILNEFSGPAEDHAVRFAKLLAINGKYGNVFFKLEPNSKMMMLVGSQTNREMAPSKLAEMVELLATVAVETDSLWKVVSTEEDGRVSLVGNWSYEDSGRTMQFWFQDDSRFRAVFGNKDNKDTFLGTFEVDASDILLTSDEGDRLVLPVENLTEGQLTIRVDGTRYVLVRR